MAALICDSNSSNEKAAGDFILTTYSDVVSHVRSMPPTCVTPEPPSGFAGPSFGEAPGSATYQ